MRNPNERLAVELPAPSGDSESYRRAGRTSERVLAFGASQDIKGHIYGARQNTESIAKFKESRGVVGDNGASAAAVEKPTEYARLRYLTETYPNRSMRPARLDGGRPRITRYNVSIQSAAHERRCRSFVSLLPLTRTGYHLSSQNAWNN